MSVETLTRAILHKMPGLNKCRQEFFVHIVLLFLRIRGRSNFLNLARYGDKNEQTYRNQFSTEFDFGGFNRELILSNFSGQRLNVFDPSHVSKSGNCTPGVGYFWSGTADKAKWGLEVCAFAVVDIEANTALHHFVEQTIPTDDQGLMDFYIGLLRKNAPEMLKTSRYLAVDAYFSKWSFVDAACGAGLDVISRLRSDAVVHYAPPQLKDGEKPMGRPKKYGKRVNFRDIDVDQLPIIEANDHHRTFAGKAWVKSLKRMVVINIVQFLGANGDIKSAKVYFCTDLSFAPAAVFNWYRSRFQIEFLLRDAKQFAGLEHTQSRQKEAMDFHFNLSLTAVSVAKCAYYLSLDKEKRTSFSMSDIKTAFFNEMMVDRVFDAFAKCPDITKSHPVIQLILNLGKIAA